MNAPLTPFGATNTTSPLVLQDFRPRGDRFLASARPSASGSGSSIPINAAGSGSHAARSAPDDSVRNDQTWQSSLQGPSSSFSNLFEDPSSPGRACACVTSNESTVLDDTWRAETRHPEILPEQPDCSAVTSNVYVFQWRSPYDSSRSCRCPAVVEQNPPFPPALKLQRL